MHLVPVASLSAIRLWAAESKRLRASSPRLRYAIPHPGAFARLLALRRARSWDRISTGKLNAIVRLLEMEGNMTLATLVDGTDLNLWANRRDSQAELPRLVRRLIHATVERVERIALPADEGVQLGGWDGIVEVAEGNAYVPDGLSVWDDDHQQAALAAMPTSFPV